MWRVSEMWIWGRKKKKFPSNPQRQVGNKCIILYCLNSFIPCVGQLSSYTNWVIQFFSILSKNSRPKLNEKVTSDSIWAYIRPWYLMRTTTSWEKEDIHCPVQERKLLTSYPVDSPHVNGEDDAYIFKKISTKLTHKTVHPRFVTAMSI